MKIIIEKLIWDDWNINHIKKHEIIPSEVEQSLKDKDVVFISSYNKRLILLGKSEKRLITTVLQKKEKKYYYVVTSRDMAKKERIIYRQEKLRKTK